MHEVLRLWNRPEEGGPVVERESLDLVAGEGIDGDHARGRRRHVTILFGDDWADAIADLGREVDPSARRANVLVSGGSGAGWVGRTMRMGPAEIEIEGVVAPCAIMDRAADGLRRALSPSGRGGIWGRVVSGGRVRVGDALEPSPASG